MSVIDNAFALKHGESHSPIYTAWSAMKQRAERRTKAGESCEVTGGFEVYECFKQWAMSNGWRKGLCVCRKKDKGNYSPDNVRIGSRLSNSVEACAKTYRLIDPSGNMVVIRNLEGFCEGKGLCPSNMRKVHSGSRKSHKGWTKEP